MYVIIDNIAGLKNISYQESGIQLTCETETPVGKFLVTQFEFGGSFGMSLEGDCHEVDVTLIWKC
jgi:hypothetical protein